MKTYFRLWRFGWVAFVAVFLGAAGGNIISFAVHGIADAVAPGNWNARIGIALVFFLTVGLPYFGWVLEMAAGHLERYRSKLAFAAKPSAPPNAPSSPG